MGQISEPRLLSLISTYSIYKGAEVSKRLETGLSESSLTDHVHYIILFSSIMYLIAQLIYVVILIFLIVHSSLLLAFLRSPLLETTSPCSMEELLNHCSYMAQNTRQSRNITLL